MADKNMVLFLAANTSGNGTVTPDELKNYFKACGREITDAEVTEFGADGGLNHEQFQKMMEDMKKAAVDHKQIVDALMVFDKGGKGMVKTADVNKAMTTMGDKKFSKMEAAELKLWADLDGDDTFGVEEWVTLHTAAKPQEHKD